MLWIIQGNLSKEDGLRKLIDTVKNKNIPYRLVKSIPFTDYIVDMETDINTINEKNVPDLIVDNNQKMVTMGSYTLARTAKKRGWTPGAFINDNFEFSKWLSGWGKENMLNAEAIEAKIKDIVIPEEWITLFARPCEDTKFFSGTVFERDNLKFWLNEVMKGTDKESLNAETRIIIAPIKKILAEYRLFVVDSNIVTGSMYKVRDQVIYGEHVDPLALSFAESMISKWEPDRAYVLDIAITDEGPKIIEVNNINSSGFYLCDMDKIVDAIEKMVF